MIDCTKVKYVESTKEFEEEDPSRSILFESNGALVTVQISGKNELIVLT